MKKRIPIYVCLFVVAGLALISRGGLGAAGTSRSTRGARIALRDLPDLIVDQASLRQHWVVRVEDLPASFCSVQEGNITPGEHTLLRFNVSTPNIGDADLRLGDPNEHIAAGDGLYEFASCHNHFHFRHYALYQLIDPHT